MIMNQEIKRKIQSISSKLSNFILIECPDVTVNQEYVSKTHRTIYLTLDYDDKVYSIRISDHRGRGDDTYQYEIIVADEPIKYCSTVMRIIYELKGGY